jgi:hypothetical protein
VEAFSVYGGLGKTADRSFPGPDRHLKPASQRSFPLPPDHTDRSVFSADTIGSLWHDDSSDTGLVGQYSSAHVVRFHPGILVIPADGDFEKILQLLIQHFELLIILDLIDPPEYV